MRTIEHYALTLSDTQEIWMPVGAKLLGVAMFDGTPYVHALVDPNQGNTNTRTIFAFGTDRPDIPVSIQSKPYMGTIQTGTQTDVWHVFDGGVS